MTTWNDDRFKNALAAGLCTQCLKEPLKSTRKCEKCLRRQAELKMIKRGGPKPRVLVKKRTLVTNTRRWKIQHSAWFRDWSI